MIKILECSVSELNKSGAKNKTKDQGQKIQFISGFVAYNRRTEAKKRGRKEIITNVICLFL